MRSKEGRWPASRLIPESLRVPAHPLESPAVQETSGREDCRDDQSRPPSAPVGRDPVPPLRAPDQPSFLSRPDFLRPDLVGRIGMRRTEGSGPS